MIVFCRVVSMLGSGRWCVEDGRWEIGAECGDVYMRFKLVCLLYYEERSGRSGGRILPPKAMKKVSGNENQRTKPDRGNGRCMSEEWKMPCGR